MYAEFVRYIYTYFLLVISVLDRNAAILLICMFVAVSVTGAVPPQENVLA